MTASICKEDGCTSPVKARGWCSRHYQRWYHHGDPAKVAWERGNPVANFWPKVDRRGDGECWPWLGYVDRDGYGHFMIPKPGGGQNDEPAHRFAYEMLVGPIPDGLHLDHVKERGCTLRSCVNPAHLDPVTPGENIRRGETGRIRAAQQRAKTHCPSGHPYDEANTIIYGGAKKYRRCRACERIRKQRRRAHAKQQQ